MTEKKIINLHYPPKDMSQEEVQGLIGELTEAEIQESERITAKAKQKVLDGKGAKPPFRGGK